MSDDFITVKIPRDEAEELIQILCNYMEHYTDGTSYVGEPEVPMLVNRLVSETYEVDYSADDLYAGGAA